MQDSPVRTIWNVGRGLGSSPASPYYDSRVPILTLPTVDSGRTSVVAARQTSRMVPLNYGGKWGPAGGKRAVSGRTRRLAQSLTLPLGAAPAHSPIWRTPQAVSTKLHSADFSSCLSVSLTVYPNLSHSAFWDKLRSVFSLALSPCRWLWFGEYLCTLTVCHRCTLTTLINQCIHGKEAVPALFG